MQHCSIAVFFVFWFTSVLDRIKIGNKICSSTCFIQQHIFAVVLVLKGRGYKVKGQTWLTYGTLIFSRELAGCKITLIFNFFACERNKMSECSRDWWFIENLHITRYYVYCCTCFAMLYKVLMQPSRKTSMKKFYTFSCFHCAILKCLLHLFSCTTGIATTLFIAKCLLHFAFFPFSHRSFKI